MCWHCLALQHLLARSSQVLMDRSGMGATGIEDCFARCSAVQGQSHTFSEFLACMPPEALRDGKYKQPCGINQPNPLTLSLLLHSSRLGILRPAGCGAQSTMAGTVITSH
jgi:hypothetical protein